MARTMGWRFQGRPLVVVHTKHDPTKVEWQRLIRDNIERASGHATRTRRDLEQELGILAKTGT